MFSTGFATFGLPACGLAACGAPVSSPALLGGGGVAATGATTTGGMTAGAGEDTGAPCVVVSTVAAGTRCASGYQPGNVNLRWRAATALLPIASTAAAAMRA